MITLKLRRVAIDTYKENVAYLHRECAFYRSEGFQALNKIEVCSGKYGSPIIAVLNVVDDENICQLDELGVSEQGYEQLGLPEGTAVCVSHAIPPVSIKDIHKKIAGECLSFDEYMGIARDIVANRYSKIEMAAFLVACSETGMEREEVLNLTRAMIDTGDRLDWGEQLVVDKHCIGGIPGNRTTLMVVPIVAAHGMLMPKTSSRAITSPAGTADTMEVLADVNLDPGKLREIVHRERACIAWGGNARLAPLDDILISVERPLFLDSPGQMVASILSKKIAAGTTHLLIDIPVGPTAKMHNRMTALRLRKLFEYVADRMGLHLVVVFTDGTQPVGRGIGPVLEIRDVLQVLQNDPSAPAALREKALQLAGRILEFDPDVRGGQGYFMARDILDSGRAFNKLQDIIRAQGANKASMTPGSLQYEVLAPAAGVVNAIDNKQIAHIARLAGAPMDKGAGLDLHYKLGDQVRKGDPLYTIYAEFLADFNFAKESAGNDMGYKIGDSYG